MTRAAAEVDREVPGRPARLAQEEPGRGIEESSHHLEPGRCDFGVSERVAHWLPPRCDRRSGRPDILSLMEEHRKPAAPRAQEIAVGPRRISPQISLE